MQNNQTFAFTRGYFWGIRTIDNASYHNVKTEDTVCQNFSKKNGVLQSYLTQHNIPFSATDTKKVLYEKIKQEKTPESSSQKSMIIGSMTLLTSIYTVFFAVFFFNFDHMFFCFCPHIFCNFYESGVSEFFNILIWAQVKGFVAKNNTTFRLKDVKELTYAAFIKITKDVLCKIALENSFFLSKIWAHRIFCFNIVITCII
jgi:hypothetical protein